MAPNSTDLLNVFAWLEIAVGVTSIIASYFLTTPYGRYSRSVWGFGVPAQLAWLLQECPSFLVPFSLFLASDSVKDLISINISPNIFLILMFMVHYFRR